MNRLGGGELLIQVQIMEKKLTKTAEKDCTLRTKDEED